MSTLTTFFHSIARYAGTLIRPITFATATLWLSACGLLDVQRSGSTSASVPALANFPDTEEAQLKNLILAMRDLLNLSSDIARTQFARRLPSHNTTQDERWMKIALQLGNLQRLPEQTTRTFMQGQIEAVNFAKRGLFALWEKEPSKLALKPQIDTIAENQIGELIQSFARAQSALKMKGARAAIEAIALMEMPNRTALSEPARKLAIGPLLQMAAP